MTDRCEPTPANPYVQSCIAGCSTIFNSYAASLGFRSPRTRRIPSSRVRCWCGEDVSISFRKISKYAAAFAIAILAVVPRAFAGGSPENAVLIIDPSDATSMYVGNYYKNARNIPDTNVLYMNSKAIDYATFARSYLIAFTGSLSQRNIADHADYAVVAPFNGFYVPTGTDPFVTCIYAARYSISSVYTTSQLGALPVVNNSPNVANQYFGDASYTALGFSSNQGYLNGAASTDPSASEYYIGAMLGYTYGQLGNSVQDLLAMIDRSVSADGNGRSVGGTFYYMNNTADSLRNLRACGSDSGCSTPTLYNAAAARLQTLGFSASVLPGVLPPNGTTNVLGVMTGSATQAIPGAAFTFAPGAFGDTLTSWAALFDCTGSCQTPVSAWIQQGASGSQGSVEEPCAFAGIFPTANFHYYYAQGMSLGESYLRSLQYVPTHGLLYGDPLTRPFAYIPAVTVSNPPTGNQSGIITITPSGSSPNPVASIASFDLLVDGVKMSSTQFGQSLSLDTTKLSDGRHDLRVLGYDNTPVRNVGRWIGTLDTMNFGHTVILGLSRTAGFLTQTFSFSYNTGLGAVSEARLVQNGRVVAATSIGGTGRLTVYGQNLGAGISNVHMEVLYTDGHLAESLPVSVNVVSNGTPAGPAPVAYSYSKNVHSSTATAFLVELPASYDAAPNTATYTLLNNPTQAFIPDPGVFTSPGYLIVKPWVGATGSEQLQFQVTTPAGTSNIATVTLNY